MLRNQWGRYLQSHELLPLLGIRRLPIEGFHEREIQGVTFRCEPARSGSRHHRVKYLCTCGRWIPYGRAGQHSKACNGSNSHES